MIHSNYKIVVNVSMGVIIQRMNCTYYCFEMALPQKWTHKHKNQRERGKNEETNRKKATTDEE